MVETRQSSKRMSTPPRLMSLPKRGKGSKKSTTLDAPDWDATKPLTASVQRAQDKCGEHYVRLIQANLEELKRLFQDNEQHEQIKRKIAIILADIEEMKRLAEDISRHEQHEQMERIIDLLLDNVREVKRWKSSCSRG